MRELLYISLLTTLLIFSQCAQIVSPGGGEKDITPPKIDTSLISPSNFSINFTANSIVIPFDEYIRLNNPQKTVIISPALNKQPEYKIKGKSLIVTFQEPLEENTTYSIQFLGTLMDITENNKIPLFQYVFSTGNYLDSLQLNGTVKDAFNLNSVNDFLVGLYPVNSFDDTLLSKGRPFYISKTDARGNYSFNALKEGDYYLFAWEDNNGNLKYERENEMIGFYNEVTNPADSKGITTVYSFLEEPVQLKVASSSFSEPGKVSIAFNRPVRFPYFFKLHHESLRSKWTNYSWGQQHDSLTIFIPEKVDAEKIRVQLKEDKADTLMIEVPQKGSEESIKLSTSREFISNRPIVLNISHPIDTIVGEKLTVFNQSDSVFLTDISIEKTHYRKLAITADFEGDKSYQLIIKDGFVSDIYNRPNKADTFFVRSLNVDQLSTLKIGVNSKQTVIVEIIDNRGKVVDRYHGEKFNNGESISTLLHSGQYKLRAIFDVNNNGIWDTGSIPLRKQAEKVIYYEGKIDLKKGWEQEIEWIIPE